MKQLTPIYGMPHAHQWATVAFLPPLTVICQLFVQIFSQLGVATYIVPMILVICATTNSGYLMHNINNGELMRLYGLSSFVMKKH